MKNTSLNPTSFLQRLKLLPLISKVTLILLIICILSSLIWSFTFWLAIKTKGNGITLTKEGLIEVKPKIKGTIIKLHVKVGQSVKKGDLLVEIQNAEDLLIHQSTNIKLENLQKEYDRLKNQISIEEEALSNALKSEIDANKNSIEQLEKRIKSLTYELNLRKSLFEKGLVSNSVVRETETELVQQEIEIENVKSRLAELYVEMSQGYRVTELSSKGWEIADAKKDLAIYQARIDDGKIYSPENGRVIALFTDIGEVINAGDPILIIESDTEKKSGMLIRGYFSIASGSDIVKGTPVIITFPHLHEKEFGSMLGVVESVSKYAISAESLYKTIYNAELIQKLLGTSSAVIEVIVHPLMNPERPDEYLWTTPKAPKISISTGTICILEAVVEERNPLYFVIPIQSFKRRPLIPLEVK